MKSSLVHAKGSRNIETLRRFQGMGINQKIAMAEGRIQQFYEALGGQVYVSFSGGKDSTVLLHLVRKLYPEVPAVFCNTGLEYPEIVDFVRQQENVTVLTPAKSFVRVIQDYGIPIVSKEVAQKIYEIRTTESEKLRKKRLEGQDGNGKLSEKWKFLIDAPFKISHHCCNILKKAPFKAYERRSGRAPYLGTMAHESRLRETTWLRHGCNSFQGRPASSPIAFWMEEDIRLYARLANLDFSRIYETEERTGCMFCLFGCQFDDEDGAARFDRMEKSHPKQFKVCENMGIIDALRYLQRHLDDGQSEFDFMKE